MRQYQHQLGLLTGAVAISIIAAQPLQAATTQVTKIQLESSADGIELRLQTLGEQENPPKIFTISRGNDFVADIIDTQLKLQGSKKFRQENPISGIASIEVMPLDTNNIRVIVKGETTAPTGQILRQEAQGITLSFTPETSNQASAQNPANIAEMPTPQTPQTIAQTPESQPNTPSPKPEILFPNPEILIEGKPAPPASAVQPVAPTPSFLPRAVAPPVGDIAVSNINSTPEFIDLGTQTRVPRLVLRDAPVREVLGVLARYAGLNVIFTDTGAEEEGDETQEVSETISLDLENEPVQDVFNSVLMVSRLKANRRGRTIFVGAELPTAARNIITRTLRLNQVTSSNAAAFLASQGAGVQQLFTPTEQIVDPETQRIVREIEQPTELVPLTVELPEGQTIPLLLNGLAVSSDDRLNSITMVGEPRQIEIATAFLTQLDARRRQVAVNVKIVDVDLDNEENYSSSFSFGINDTFVIQDQGSAIVRFGDTRPPNSAESAASVFSAPVIAFPAPAGATLEPFFDQVNAPFGNYSEPNRTLFCAKIIYNKTIIIKSPIRI